jgi:hypothetical protein
VVCEVITVYITRQNKKRRKLFLDCLDPEDGGSMHLQNVIIYQSAWFHMPEGLNIHEENAKKVLQKSEHKNIFSL